MKSAPFKYVRPDSLEAALAVLAEVGDEAKLLAGGQSLVPMMNMRLARPSMLIDISRLSELAYIDADDAKVRIGALTTHATVEESQTVNATLPGLSASARHIGHWPIRRRGTFGGSIAHAKWISSEPTHHWGDLS